MNMEEFNEEVASKLPLAEAVLQSFSYLTAESFLDEVFEKYRGRSYEGTLSFATIVSVIADALLEHDGSGHRALKQAHADHELEASQEAWYGKLRRIPESLSQGFLLEGTQRLLGVMPTKRSPLPRSLRMFDATTIDGKKIKNAAKRLKPTRQFRGSVLGGKVLVALDIRSGMAVAMNSHEDGETNDCPLVPGLLEQLAELPGNRQKLCVLDRQFCDLKVPAVLAKHGFHFVIRYHPKVTFTRDATHPVSKGNDADGRRYVDEQGWIGKETDHRRRYVRRITLTRPGAEDVILITDLLDETKYPASDLLELYRMRWGIEKVFQRITEVFHLRQLISSSPKGTIFQCAFCLLLYNLIELERSYIAVAQKLDCEPISMENLFYSVHRQLISWTEMLSTAWTVTYFQQPLTESKLIKRLHQLLDPLWKDEWLKSSKKNYTPKKRGPPTSGGHTSVFRLIRKKSTA
jgi:hypothetical protein